VCMLAVGCGGTGKTASSGSAGSPSDSVFAGAELSPARPAPAFALHDQQGSLVQLAAQRGRLVVVTFLYTHCRDVCPLIANNLNSVLHRLGPDAGQLRVLAVSVDPKGDTPAAVRRYARQHALLPQFHYLIGTRRELAPVWRSYHVAVSGGGGQVNHSAYTVLIDREGKQRVLYASDFRPAEVLRDVRRLLGRQA
jgi:protein SCO1